MSEVIDKIEQILEHLALNGSTPLLFEMGIQDYQKLNEECAAEAGHNEIYVRIKEYKNIPVYRYQGIRRSYVLALDLAGFLVSIPINTEIPLCMVRPDFKEEAQK